MIDSKVEHNTEFIKSVISPHVLSVGPVPLIKEALSYQIFADRLNFLCIGSAASGAKSSHRFSLRKLVPDNFDYVTATGITNVGLREVAKSFIDWGILQIDEMDKMDDKDKRCLYDIMQFQIVKEDKYRHHEERKAPINVFSVSNPKGNGGRWIDYGNPKMMEIQMPFDIPMLRRFHFNLFTRSYTEEEFDKINRFILDNGENNPLYSKPFLKSFENYVEKARSIDINVSKVKVPERVFSFLKNVKRFEEFIVTPITPELARGCSQIALAKARIRLSDTIEEEDWNGTIKFLINCLETGGLTHRLINSLRK